MLLRVTLFLLLAVPNFLGALPRPPADTLSAAARWFYLDRPLTFDHTQTATFLDTDRRTLEAELGRPLSLLERFAFRRVKKRLARALQRGTTATVLPARSSGTFRVGMVYGATGAIGLFFLLLDLVNGHVPPPRFWAGFALGLTITLLLAVLFSYLILLALFGG